MVGLSKKLLCNNRRLPYNIQGSKIFNFSMYSTKILFSIIILAVCLTQFAADIYAPALPVIAGSFNSSIDLAQLSMAIYMLGVALSQLIYGPISEGIGRKKPMLVGLSIMLVGSIICCVASSIYMLILGRFVQGCGAGACAALWRSVFRDAFKGDELAKYGSYLVVFVMFIVPAAPLLGGYLENIFGWTAIFTFMCGYAIVALICMIFWFEETNKHYHREKLNMRYAAKTFYVLLTSPVFMSVTFCTFLSYGAFFSWFTVGPVLLIEKLGMDPVDFGWITFIGGGSAYALSGWLNGKFVKQFGISNMMRFGWTCMIISGTSMLYAKYFVGLNVFAIVIPVIVFYFGSTFIWPNAFAAAFTPFGEIAGYAGSLYGFMQIGGAAVVAGAMSYLPDDNQEAFAIVLTLLSVASWLVYELGSQLSKSAMIKEESVTQDE